MKTLIAIFAGVASFSIFAAEEAFVQTEERMNKRLVLRRLERIESNLEERRVQTALSQVRRLIRNLRSGHDDNDGDYDNDVNTYNHLGMVYNTSNSNFRCNYNDQVRAKNAADNSATDACYREGNRRCRLMSNRILTNGYLGTINGTYYGYGCKASAIVQGSK